MTASSSKEAMIANAAQNPKINASVYHRPEYNDLDRTKFFTLIPMASLSLRILTYPANVIKTLLQAGGNGTNTLQCAKQLYAQNGVKALYRGFSVSVMHVAVGPFYMMAFENTKHNLLQRQGMARSDGSQQDFKINVLAGGFASIMSNV